MITIIYLTFALYGMVILSPNSSIANSGDYDFKIYSETELIDQEFPNYDTIQIGVVDQEFMDGNQVLTLTLDESARNQLGVVNDSDVIYSSLYSESSTIILGGVEYRVENLDYDFGNGLKYNVIPDDMVDEVKYYISYLSNDKDNMVDRNKFCQYAIDEYDASCSDKFTYYKEIRQLFKLIVLIMFLIMLSIVQIIQSFISFKFSETKAMLLKIGLNQGDTKYIYFVERTISLIILIFFSLTFNLIFDVGLVALFYNLVFVVVTYLLSFLLVYRKIGYDTKMILAKGNPIISMLARIMNNSRTTIFVLLFSCSLVFTLSMFVIFGLESYSIDARVEQTISSDYLIKQVPFYDDDGEKLYTHSSSMSKLYNDLEQDKENIASRVYYYFEDDTDYGYAQDNPNLGVYSYDSEVFEKYDISEPEEGEAIIKVNDEFGHFLDENSFQYDNGRELSVGDEFNVQGVDFKTIEITAELPILIDRPRIIVLVNESEFKKIYGEEGVVAITVDRTDDLELENYSSYSENNMVMISREMVYQSVVESITILYYATIFTIVVIVVIMFIILINVMLMRFSVFRKEIILLNKLGLYKWQIVFVYFGDLLIVIFFGYVISLIIGIILGIVITYILTNFIVTILFIMIIYLVLNAHYENAIV